LQHLDADAFDELAGRWAAQCTAPGPGRRRVIAVNGKTLRGSGGNQQPARHLLAALDHAHGVVLGQAGVGTKTNEIPSFIALLDKLDIEAAVISGDALHAQRGHATYLHRRGAHYLLIVKRNQHSLHAQLAALPWRDVPVAYDERERRHGRTERRTLKITSVARGLAFPHASQAIQSFPGLGRRLTARIAGEIGEHIEQFTTPNSLQCYAGSAPATPPVRQARPGRRPPACLQPLPSRHGAQMGVRQPPPLGLG